MSHIITVVVNRTDEGRARVDWFASDGLARPLALEAVRAVERGMVEQMVRAEMEQRAETEAEPIAEVLQVPVGDDGG